jgi:hypothetical protein
VSRHGCLLSFFCSSSFARHYSLHPQLALRAIRCANVRFGIPAFAVRRKPEELFNSGAGQAGIHLDLLF